MSALLEVLVGAGAGCTAAAVIGGFVGRIIGAHLRHITSAAVSSLESKIDERFNKNDQVSRDISLQVATIKAQFGPNGGGIRQAVNEVAVTVARLEGAFRQHLQEAKD